MSAHASPNIITDGLVFLYDTDDGKSYKGEPTTNLNPFTLSDSGTDGSGQSSVGTRTVISDNYVRIVDAASNTRQSHVITGLTASTTYTISIGYKKLVGTPTFRFQIQDYSGSSYLRTIKFTNTNEIGIEDKEGWQLASWTFTLGSDANAVRIWYQDGADYTTYTHSFELQNPQLEAKSHATPYVDGTRSATQGLIDRTGTSTIDISNASFDSNSQMSFDGSDDIINTGLFSGRNPSTDPFTVEAMVKSDVTSGSKIWVDATSNGSNQRFYSALIDSTSHAIGIQGSAWSDPTPGDTNWHHQVIVMDGSTAKAYNNGELASSKSYTSYTLAGGLNIGGRSGYRWVGQIPIFKIYDRALTQTEVAQNYNAFKDRFGL
jgi:hypothetical protein